LVPGEVDTRLEELIFDLAYEVELKYNVVFGLVVHVKEFWASEKRRLCLIRGSFFKKRPPWLPEA
jgi:hypothetical protein